MNVKVKKSVFKETEKLPKHVQEAAKEQINNLKVANTLGELENIEHMQGTDEPYFRLKFNDYRFLLYLDPDTNIVNIRSLLHRKDAYKKQNLPWL